MNVELNSLPSLPDVKVICPRKHADERGFFSEVYRSDWRELFSIDGDFMQDNHAFTRDVGVLRGLHYQTPPFAQDKLVRVVRGAIWDVVVDIRRGSATYGCWAGVEVSAENWKQVLVPRGFAHGYVTLEENTEVLYKVSNPYAPDHDYGIAWDDAELGIDWRLPVREPVLSAKDQNHPLLRDAGEHFFYYES